MLDSFRSLFTQPPAPARGPVHAVHPGWGEYTQTVLLPSGQSLRLRPLAQADGPTWSRLRIADRAILEPVEPTVPGTWGDAHSKSAWRSHFFGLRQAADSGVVVPLVIEVDGEFAGQVTLGNIQQGIVSECWIGYWVARPYQGMGVATAACALGTDHAFRRVRLHRVTATYLPDNQASARVLAANGYQEEGYLRRNLHINGSWRDHILVAITNEDYSTSCLSRLIDAGRVRRA